MLRASSASFHILPNCPGNQGPAHRASERLIHLPKVTQPKVGFTSGVPDPKSLGLMLPLLTVMAVDLVLGWQIQKVAPK